MQRVSTRALQVAADELERASAVLVEAHGERPAAELVAAHRLARAALGNVRRAQDLVGLANRGRAHG